SRRIFRGASADQTDGVRTRRGTTRLARCALCETLAVFGSSPSAPLSLSANPSCTYATAWLLAVTSRRVTSRRARRPAHKLGEFAQVRCLCAGVGPGVRVARLAVNPNPACVAVWPAGVRLGCSLSRAYARAEPS